LLAQKKEFFFRGSAPGGQPTRRGGTVYKCPPNFRTQHQPPKRPSFPMIFPALPYATGVADCWAFVKCKLYDVHGSVKVRAVGASPNPAPRFRPNGLRLCRLPCGKPLAFRLSPPHVTPLKRRVIRKDFLEGSACRQKLKDV
jgi:hypothetical protein